MDNCRGIIEVNMKKILDSLEKQYDKFIDYLSKNSIISIGTLGPTGTTSHYALKYFIDSVKEFENMSVKIVLHNNFRLVHEDLLKGEIDLALIPNAYENITEMYWDIRLKNVLSFLLETPPYGLATNRCHNNSDLKVKISTCSPVKHLVYQFANEKKNRFSKFEIVPAESTAHAAKLVNEGIADYAITNATSLIKEHLEFVSSPFSAEVIWTVFMNREKYLQYYNEVLND